MKAGICRFVVLTSAVALASAPAAMAELPQYGPVRADDGRAMLTDETYVRIALESSIRGWDSPERMDVNVRIPRGGTGRVVKKWRMDVDYPQINNDKPFTLATGTSTLDFTLVRRGYWKKIWSYQFDPYVNVCINGGKTTYAQGGNLYCEVRVSEKIRVRQRSKIKNWPRPKLVLERELGQESPSCQPGAQKSEPLGKTMQISECREGDSYIERPWLREIVADVWSGTKWERVTTSEKYQRDRAYGWTTIGEQPLPPPTGAATAWSVRSSAGSYTTWNVSGTYSCSYFGSYLCPSSIYVKTTDGLWYRAASQPSGNLSKGVTWTGSILVYGSATPTAEVGWSNTG